MQPLVLSLGYCRKGRLCFFAVGSPDVSVNALKKSDTAIVQWEVPSAKLAGLGSVLLLSWLLSWLSGSSLWGALLVAAGSLAKKRLPPCSDAAAAEAAAALPEPFCWVGGPVAGSARAEGLAEGRQMGPADGGRAGEAPDLRILAERSERPHQVQRHDAGMRLTPVWSSYCEGA
mmetsp:Transcript_47530/g.85525  ORF Transcript_47530/g.85525 Transcript_47530/m.85525 type:complete len:174 (-) Transcript_47530:440-961(-)